MKEDDKCCKHCLWFDAFADIDGGFCEDKEITVSDTNYCGRFKILNKPERPEE